MADVDDVGEFVVSQQSARVQCTLKCLQGTRHCFEKSFNNSLFCVFNQVAVSPRVEIPWRGLEPEARRRSAGARV